MLFFKEVFLTIFTAIELLRPRVSFDSILYLSGTFKFLSIGSWMNN